jgi:hypothetical protein
MGHLTIEDTENILLHTFFCERPTRRRQIRQRGPHRGQARLDRVRYIKSKFYVLLDSGLKSCAYCMPQHGLGVVHFLFKKTMQLEQQLTEVIKGK